MIKERSGTNEGVAAAELRVRGRVQGVGFRPMVWRVARELGLHGYVLNDGEGVLIRVGGPAAAIDALIDRLRTQPPPLAEITGIERRLLAKEPPSGFRIVETNVGEVRTEIAPDAALCRDCAAEIRDPAARRHRYPFTTCTNCGPRFSVARAIPFERSRTTMDAFPLCQDCAREYHDPSDRRFHAETTACAICGPKARLVRLDRAGPVPMDDDDVPAMVGDLLRGGVIVAVKGIGGYQLACDATNAETVRRLRHGKRRDAKPFALMARDLEVLRQYCVPTLAEIREITGSRAPIVIMPATGPLRLPDAVAPGLQTLGFMLPTTPLHQLSLESMDVPVVMTSGNPSGEPQIVDDGEACVSLAGIADYALVHDREIASRIDDSVVRVVADRPRLLRRARGFAPARIDLPRGFESAPDLLAYGGDLKGAFCLVKDGAAVLSHHQGDLDEAATFDEFRDSLARYESLLAYRPSALAADMHPEYRSAKLARSRSRSEGLPLVEIQHHHAHIASCLAENGYPLEAPPVLGIALDGLGWGDDGTLWGGEFLLADYRQAVRIASLKPVALLGGDRAAREPWRNLYAHLCAFMPRAELHDACRGLELYELLRGKPRGLLDAMLKGGINAPLASSCGRLFDAAAAALGICQEVQAYEGEAACRLEAVIDLRIMQEETDELAYPFEAKELVGTGHLYIEPASAWRAMLADLRGGVPVAIMAGRFHKGLARGIVALATQLAQRAPGRAERFTTVALSGGCFQNAVLATEVERRLKEASFEVLTQGEVPANDGGLALGQAAVAAARLLGGTRK